MLNRRWRGWLTTTKELQQTIAAQGAQFLGEPTIEKNMVTWDDVVLPEALYEKLDSEWQRSAVWGLEPTVVTYTGNPDNCTDIVEWLGDAVPECTTCDGTGEYEGDYGPKSCGLCNSRLIAFIDTDGIVQHADWGDRIEWLDDGSFRLLRVPMEVASYTVWVVKCGMPDCEGICLHKEPVAAYVQDDTIKELVLEQGWALDGDCGVLCPDCV